MKNKPGLEALKGMTLCSHGLYHVLITSLVMKHHVCTLDKKSLWLSPSDMVVKILFESG